MNARRIALATMIAAVLLARAPAGFADEAAATPAPRTIYRPRLVPGEATRPPDQPSSANEPYRGVPARR